MTGLVDVFECEEVSKSNVIDEFTFAIGGDERWKFVGGFQSIGQLFADVYRDELF